MPSTPGKDAVVRWVEEVTPGTTPTNPALKLFSKETLRCSLSLDVGQQESLDIGNVDVEEYFNVQRTFGLEVECHLYDVDRILDFGDRSGTNLKSYTLEYIPDATAATKHYYRCTGWVIGSIELGVSPNEAWVATFTFIGGLIVAPVTVDPGIGAGSREAKAAITDAIAHFSSGIVTLGGASWATFVGSFSLTIENDVTPQYTMGNRDPVTNLVRGGTRRISGSVDISLDAGAKEMWDRVVAGAAHTIEVPFGTATGAQLLTLTGVRFPNIEVESNTDDQTLQGGQDFTTASYSRSTVP